MRLAALLKERNLPALLQDKNGNPIRTREAFEKRRTEIRALLCEHEYGQIPPPPDALTVKELSSESVLGGEAMSHKLRFHVTCKGKEFSFPLTATIPQKAKKVPAIVMINTTEAKSSHFLPLEAVVKRGFAVFDLPVHEVTSDDDDFTSGLSALLVPDRTISNASGKLVVWAWAAMRVMDYIQTLPAIESERVAVIGHSRYGKTAVVAGAFDERFAYVIANNSGCGGAAITRGKVGEGHPRIAERHGRWFCPAYLKWAETPSEIPVDQHFLLSLIPPRHLLVGSAMEDQWADPASEFLGAYSQNDIYALYGKKGLISPDEVPTTPTVLDEGEISYHLREGGHALRIDDWMVYLDYMEAH